MSSSCDSMRVTEAARQYGGASRYSVDSRDVPVLSYRSIGTRIPAFFWYLVLDIGPAKFELNIRGYYQNICSIGVSAVSADILVLELFCPYFEGFLSWTFVLLVNFVMAAILRILQPPRTYAHLLLTIYGVSSMYITMYFFIYVGKGSLIVFLLPYVSWYGSSLLNNT